jgi:hypothetical protein
MSTSTYPGQYFLSKNQRCMKVEGMQKLSRWFGERNMNKEKVLVGVA